MKLIRMKAKTKEFFLFAFLVFNLCLSTVLSAQLAPVWIQRYAGIGDNSDKYNALVMDDNGNFYACGYLFKEGNQKDFMTIKTNASGDTLWMRTYNGTNAGDDEALSLAVGPNGDIYVTGYTEGDKSNLDFLTIKYDATGNQLWLNTYNYEMAYQDDQALAIAIDSIGNCYVTGMSDQSLTSAANYDYATVKYDAGGGLVYVARKNGFGNDDDKPIGIVADNSGNCFVSGRSDSGNDDDFITIKYNASGIAQWTKLYDGGNGNDRPSGIVMTPAGDIVVTGSKDNGSDDDITTICYSNGGVQLWIKNFNGPGSGNDQPSAMTTDSAGNIYIAGVSDADPSFSTNYDFVTIKYNNGGIFQWSQTKGFSAGAGNTDSPKAIRADGSGNVYVTGKCDADASALVNDDVLTIKYDQAGVEQWSKTISGNTGKEDGGYAMVLDNADQPVIAGKINNVIGQQDAFLSKYDATGSSLFIKELNGKGDFSDNTFVVRTDASGHVFIAGYTFSTGTNRDLLIRKYDNGGNVLKTYMYNGSKNDEDEATDMVLDAAGNVYVTGFSKNSGTSSDFITIKLTNDLDTSWIRYYNHTANESDKALSVALDFNNNVYITGYSDNNPSDTINNYDIVTIKYNNSGASQWTNRFNTLADGDDRPARILTDQGGNAVITGESWNGSNYDMVTLQYSNTGNLQWFVFYAAAGNGDDKAHDMTLDQNNNIYITGYGFSVTGFEDYITIKYNQSGALQWVQPFNGAGNDEDKAHAIVLDANGNVIVTGQSDADTSVSTKNFDFVTVKYDNNGNFQWKENYNGTSNTDDIASEMVIDINGRIIVAGQAENGSTASPDKDFAVVIYDDQGALQYEGTYDGFSGTDGVNAMAYNGINSFYLAGNSNDAGSQKDIALVKYDIPVGIVEHEINEAIPLVFPNPVTEWLRIGKVDGSLVTDNFFETVFFDIHGNKLNIPFYVSRHELLVDTRELVPGVYLFRIMNREEMVVSGKFIKN